MLFNSIQFNHATLLGALEQIGFEELTKSNHLLANTRHVNNITLDSRKADKHCAFVALKGSTSDGYDYIDSAVDNGCTLILSEKGLSQSTHISASGQHYSVIAHPDLRAKLAELLSGLFELNEGEISAVTGTNGKTSVASINAQLSLGVHSKSACLGTLGLSLYSKENHEMFERILPVGANTTPDIISHYKIFKYLQQAGVEDYSLEASSHGIEQGRLSGLPINIVAFTNLSQDHLDYHGNMVSYGQAKRGLLDVNSLKHLVLNADDEESLLWLQQKAPGTQLTWYSVEQNNLPQDTERYCLAQSLVYTPNGIEFDLSSSWGNAHVSLPLFGQFNVSNALAALCIRLVKGEPFNTLIEQLQKVKGVAGRMELFTHELPHANIIVDYAHTPDALSQALKSAKQHTRGRLFCVFGCGGNRDKTKRELMGAAAAKQSDVVVLTQDNSRFEVPEDIISDIESGIPANTVVHTELERKRAIRWAFKQSTEADLIVLAGKGHEDYMEMKGQRIAYDERAFVRHLISEEAA